MNTDGIGAFTPTQLSTVQPSTKNSGANLTIDDFFQLISAQLQNQNMFDTGGDTEFMAQMVQFSMLSQMKELTATSQSGIAVSLIGKPVSIVTTNQQGQQHVVMGKVDQVSFSDGKPYFLVNGGFYQLSEITDIGA